LILGYLYIHNGQIFAARLNVGTALSHAGKVVVQGFDLTILICNAITGVGQVGALALGAKHVGAKN
jgi:hypothetical protein